MRGVMGMGGVVVDLIKLSMAFGIFYPLGFLDYHSLTNLFLFSFYIPFFLSLSLSHMTSICN